METFKEKLNRVIAEWSCKQRTHLRESSPDSRHKNLHITTVLNYLYLIKELSKLPYDVPVVIKNVNPAMVINNPVIAKFNLTMFIAQHFKKSNNKRYDTATRWSPDRCSGIQHNALNEIRNILQSDIVPFYISYLELPRVHYDTAALLTGHQYRVLKSVQSDIMQSGQLHLNRITNVSFNEMFIAEKLLGYDYRLPLTEFVHKEFIHTLSS